MTDPKPKSLGKHLHSQWLATAMGKAEHNAIKLAHSHKSVKACKPGKGKK